MIILSQLQETPLPSKQANIMKTIKNITRNAKVEVLLTIAHVSSVAAVAVFAVTNFLF